MSDAKIEHVHLNNDRSGSMDLLESDGTRITLHFIESPKGVDVLSGMSVELGRHTLSLGGVEIASRNSTHAIEFCNTYDFRHAVTAYKAKEVSGG